MLKWEFFENQQSAIVNQQAANKPARPKKTKNAKTPNLLACLAPPGIDTV